MANLALTSTNHIPAARQLSRSYTVAEVLHGNIKRYPMGVDGETLLCVFGAFVAEVLGAPKTAAVLRNQASYNIAKRMMNEALRQKREKLDG